MITWFLGPALIIWCIYARSKPDGKVEGYPLGMPRGTIRGLIAIFIVSFPFGYVLTGQQIPGLITNALFLIVAFYFEARKGGDDDINQIVKEVIHPEKVLAEKDEKKPLDLPKYSVRITLITMLALIIILNSLGPHVAFETTNTLIDLFLIISLFIIGSLIRGFGSSRHKKRIHAQISQMQGLDNKSKFEIIQELADRPKSWWKQKGDSLFSIITLIAVILALILFTIDFAMVLLELPFYTLGLKDALLMLVSVYYGLRS